MLKYNSQKENIFYYGNEIKIKIEIPNNFIDFKIKFPIFHLFKNVELNDITSLIIPNDLLSNTQIVF